MNSPQPVEMDERTIAVTNVGYKLACTLVSFALLADGMWRGLMRNEAAWDLMALACLPAFVIAAYQMRHQIPITRIMWRSRWQGLLILGLAAVVGLVTAMILTIAGMPSR